ncbi:MAG TPA: hypothetical protein VNM67_18025 [Thermoanaerobaculia bacterium]|jgi:hypothetical protein|nr:hypothetical protein [Thermoanaerobaculia bacterium]
MNPDLSSSDEGRISQHVNRFIPPDVIYMRVVGDLSDEDGHEINRQHYELGKDVDGLFFICDISELESVTSSTRKEAVEIQKKMAIAGAVILKAPLKARIFAKLILTASNLFRSEKMLVEFVNTEEEAWAWIEQQREEYKARKKSPAAAGT